MGTTTKMAIPYPEATGLVKDGWEDMKDIATQVDSKSGLVLIRTDTFSGATTHSFGSDAAPVFTSSFTNYRIILHDLATASSSSEVRFRLRANTTDNTGNGYAYQLMSASGTTQANSRTFASSWKLGGAGSGTNEISHIVMDLINPQVTKFHEYQAYAMFISGGVGPVTELYFGYETTNGTAYNGFTIFGTLNLSGTLSVYGYNK